MICRSQDFMRMRKDECSFVSIRDIERVCTISIWFLSKQDLIFERMDAKKLANADDSYQSQLSGLHRAFVLSLAVCYHASLYNKEIRHEYRQLISSMLKINGGEANKDWMSTEILKCQNVFLDEIDINKKNIAKNSALLENVFMMIICIELRIPLFIVGKPGSSKSLAKTIVARAMEGRNSKSLLFQKLKETYFFNFQCSPLTTSEMIIKTFADAARFQESSDIEKSIAVVNLDEIGLAEGSETMPLKALHPLLESGSDSADSEVSKHFKVGVIGISNWALDPAKMNRGIFVSRGEPDIEELIETAKGICEYDENILYCIQPFLQGLAQAYLDLCEKARQFKREFFGLRDYYSLIKMIYYFCSKDNHFTWNKLMHAVRRNFNGLEIDPLDSFKTALYDKLDKNVYETDPKCKPIDLIESALKGEYVESNSRYLLFITENNSSIDIIQNYMTEMVGVKPSNLSVVFGSSFRADQEYTKICTNIGKIKCSMEIGKTIILLNSYNLYESLYDALNQYYYEFAGQKYVDLGLGTHRVKCSVADSFKLIIIAEKAAVYDSKRFPIPLINRLEKHFLNSSIMLNKEQLELVEVIEKWVRTFLTSNLGSLEPNEVFIGYNSDTIASLILNLSTKKKDISNEELVKQVKINLLKCATPDSVVRSLNLERALGKPECEFIWSEYFANQKHLCLRDLLGYHLKEEAPNSLVQLTTHSKASLNNLDLEVLRKQLNVASVEACLLESFDTEKQFVSKLESFTSGSHSRSSQKKHLLLLQGDMDTKYSHDLISCVRYQLVEHMKSLSGAENYLICLLVRMPKDNVKSFIGFQLGFWSCYHLDEIDESELDLPEFNDLHNKSLSKLLNEAYNKEVELENDISDEKNEVEFYTSGLDLSVLFKKLAHNSCSLLVDTNLTRTISRIDLFIKLCEFRPFVWKLTQRLIDLQYEKESQHMQRSKAQTWLIDEAASLKQVNQYSTLRRSCQNYFETRLSPLIGYLLSFIDSYSNLDILYEAITGGVALEWKRDLWLQLFEDKELCRLNYASMRMDSKGKETGEMQRFECTSEFMRKTVRDELDENKKLKPRLPFFWLLIDHLNNLYRNFIESNKPSLAIGPNGKIFSFENYSIVISQFFEENNLYKLLNQIVGTYANSSTNGQNSADFISLLIDSYIHDFVLINCHVSNRNDLDLIKHLLKSMFELSNDFDMKYRQNLNYSLPIIHYLFDKIKPKLELYLKFSVFEPEVFSSDAFKSVYINWKYSNGSIDALEIHFDACIETIRVFKRNFKYSSFNIDRIFQLIQLLSHLLLTASANQTADEESPKLRFIHEQFEALNLLRFVLNMMLKFDTETITSEAEAEQKKEQLFAEVLNEFNSTYFKESVDFKTKNTIQNLHEFIIFSFNAFNKYIRSVYGSSTDGIAKYVEEYLNTLYVDVIEMLCFTNNQRPSDQAMEAILKVITDKKISSSIKPTAEEDSANLDVLHVQRYLLVQILFKNYNEIVEKNLSVWFNSMDFIGQNKIFSSHEEMAILFQNCVFDQYVNQTLNDRIDEQIMKSNQICLQILAEKDIMDKLFLEKKIIGKSFSVKYLLLIAKIRFIISKYYGVLFIS